MKSVSYVIHINNNITVRNTFCYFYYNPVMHVIIDRCRAVINCTHDKGKLVEKSGRKTTYLRSPHSGGYGRRVTMEKSIFYYADLPGQIYPVGRLS